MVMSLLFPIAGIIHWSFREIKAQRFKGICPSQHGKKDFTQRCPDFCSIKAKSHLIYRYIHSLILYSGISVLKSVLQFDEFQINVQEKWISIQHPQQRTHKQTQFGFRDKISLAMSHLISGDFISLSNCSLVTQSPLVVLSSYQVLN